MSIKFRVIPLITICPSTISLVVPSISVTIALSSFSNLFKSEDFPTFGFPTIPTFMPSLMSFPFSLSFSIFDKASFISIIFLSNNSLVYTIASSYSG